MTDKSFLDTNILVCAYDLGDSRKQEKAQLILTDGIERDNLVLSVQVFGEFFNVVTRKIKIPMTPDEALSVISALEILPVVDIDLTMVKRAIDIQGAYEMSYWDSLIIAAAERAECKEVISEDLNDGQVYHGIPVRNPFKHR